MAYDNLDPNDTMIVNRGNNSYSVTVDQVANSSPALEDNDVFLVNRGDKSFSVTKKIITDEIGKEGEIEAPVVVLTPPNGAGLADEEVTPAAEGITDAVESQDIVSAWNQEQTWSTGVVGVQPSYDPALLFNGVLTDLVQNPDSEGSWTFTPTIPLDYTDSVSVYTYFAGTVTLNAGLDSENVVTTTSVQQETILAEDSSGTLTSITFQGDASSPTAYWFKVDGRLLVDTGIDNSGAGTITGPKEATLTYTTDNNLSLLAVGQSMTQQPAYTPQTDTIASISTGSTTFTTSLGWGGHPSSGAGYVGTTWPSNSSWSGLSVNDSVGQGATAGKGVNSTSRVLNAGDNTCAVGDWGASTGGTEPWVLDMGEVVTISIVQSGISSLVTTDTPDQTYGSGKSGTAVAGGFKGTGRFFWWTNPGQPSINSLNVNDVISPLVLTFDSDKDIENFRVGDVVQNSPSNTPINVNQSGASIYHGSPQGLPDTFGDGLPTISYAEIRSASTNQWNDVFKPDVSAAFTYQMIELEYAVTSIQFTTQGSYIMTACSVDGVTWEQLEQSPASQTATTRTVTGGPFKYWYIGFNAATADNTDNYYLSCNAEAYVPVTIISTDEGANTITVDGGTWSDDPGSGGNNTSQIWSNYLRVIKTDTNEYDDFYSGYPPENFFEVNYMANTLCQLNAGDTSEYWYEFAPAEPIMASSFEVQSVVGYDPVTYEINFKLSNAPGAELLPTSQGIGIAGNNMFSRVDFNPPQEISAAQPIYFGMKFADDSAFTWQYLSFSKLNGEFLVDGTGSTKVTGPLLQGKGEYVSHNGTTLELTDVTSRWCVDDQSVGLKAESDDEYTDAAPNWDTAEFQSANGSPTPTVAFSAEGCTLREVKWTFQKSTGDKDGPWEDFAGNVLTDTVAIDINQDVPALSQEPTLEKDTIYRVKVEYTADSSAPVIESGWNVFKTSSGDTPESFNISGLRFDPNRNTTLQGSLGSNTFTYSAWVKPTGAVSTINLLCNIVNTNDTFIDVTSAGAFVFGNNGSSIFSAGSVPRNTWSHVVVSRDLNGQTNGWVNGVNIYSAATGGVSLQWVNKLLRSGANSSESGYSSGYMSEVYYVDGQALEASTFGKTYNGLWGPIPSETILNNITRTESPYDQRPNMEQDWSAGADAGAENAFDGQASSSYMTINDQATSTVTTANFTVDEKLEVYQLGAGAGNVYTFVVNGDTYEVNALDSAGYITIPVPAETDVVGGFTARLASGQDGLSLVRLDRRLLIDGPADNSQNWSDTVDTAGDTGMPGEPYTNMFAGENLLAQASDSSGTQLTTWTFNPPIGNGIDDVVEVKWYVSGSGLNYAPQVNGADFAASNNAWTTVPGGQVTSVGLCHNQGSAANGVYGFKVNGKELIDGGKRWDTSQVWSQGGNNSDLTNGSWENAFNGDTTLSEFTAPVSAYVSGSDATYTFPSAVTGNIGFLMSGGASSSGPGRINLSDSQVLNVTAAAAAATWVYADVTDLTGFTIDGTNVADGTALNQVSLNGKLLVDTGSFGTNGFYLPFDPAATGANYSSKTSYTGTIQDSRKVSEMFDGSLSTYFYVDGDITVTSAFGDITSVGVADTGNASDRDVEVNGSVVGTLPSDNSGNARTTTFTFSSVNANSITIKNGNLNAVYGLYVNGKLLVDHNNIGVDGSGSKNNFHDENFAVGNTSQVWSSNNSNNWNASETVRNIFDGSLSTQSFGGGDNTSTVTFTELTATNKVRAYFYTGDSVTAGGADDQWEINNVNISALHPNPGTGSTAQWVDVTSAFSLPVDITSLKAANSNQGGIFAIEIDGKILVDKNAQDTVVDTPIKNYSVMTGNANGNLHNKNAGDGVWTTSVQTVSSGKYYAEFQVISSGSPNGTIFGIAIDASASTYAGITYNGELVGTGVPGGVYLRDYNDINTHYEPGDLLSVMWDLDNKVVSFFMNGDYANRTIFQYGANAGTSSYNYDRFGILENGPTGSINMGQQPFVYGDHDLKAGTVVFDGVTYETLYTELEGYQVAGGYFYDEKNQRAVRGSDLIKRFGIDHADPRLGIYELCEVPNYRVIGYEKVYDQYKALRDYTPEVKVAEAETAAAEAETAEVQALADKYLNYLRAAACMWMVDKVYEAGTIVEFNGQLYRSTINATATADTDPGDQTDRWEALGISLS